ncbi:MAG: YiiD C-terminal domain-containing protein [Gracilimonas sp.]
MIPEKQDIENFLEMFERFGKARITLQAHIKNEGTVLAEFEGDFVVIR